MKSVGAVAMSNLSNIRIYDIFRKDLRLPDEKAFELVQAIDEAVKGNADESLKDVATKAFVREEIYLTKEVLREELHLMKDALKEEIYLTKGSLKEEIGLLRDSLKGEISSLRKEAHLTEKSLGGEIASVDRSLTEEIGLLKEEVQKLDLKIDLKETQTKNELLKAIFWSGIVQFLAIVGSMIAIINFMLRR